MSSTAHSAHTWVPTNRTTINCPAPILLTPSPLTTSVANLTWTCEASVSTYSVRWRVVNGSWNQTDAITATEYRLQSLMPSTAYEWQVLANCQNGSSSAWSNIGTFQTASCGMAILGPVSQTIAGGTEATLAIQFSGEPRWGYSLYRNGRYWTGTGNITRSAYTLQTTVPNSSTFTLDVAESTVCGVIPVSGTALVTVVCHMPTALTASPANWHTAGLRWNGGADIGYDVRWRISGASSWSTVAVNTATPPLSYTLTNLIAHTDYEWQVRSRCTEGWTSAYQVTEFFTTPDIPLCLSLVTTKSGQWTDPDVWSCGRVPNAGDNPLILANHTIIVPANTTAIANQLTNAGVLLFASPTAQLALGVSFAGGLIAYYPFNGNANDKSGYGHNGVPDGAKLTTDRFGQADKAYAFDGINDKINLPSLADYTGKISNEYTLSLWFKPGVDFSQSTPRNTFLGVPNGLFDLRYQQGNLSLEVMTNPSRVTYFYLVPATFAANTWHHVLCSVKAWEPVKVYIDGQEFTLGYANPSLATDGGLRTQLGYQLPYGLWMNGSLDEIRIYGRAFTPEQARLLYALEAP